MKDLRDLKDFDDTRCQQGLGFRASSASVWLADDSRIDFLDLRYKVVNFEAGQSLCSPNRRAQIGSDSFWQQSASSIL